MNMIERVAFAMGVADNDISCIGTVEGYRKILAKAAIEAMREPDEIMLSKGNDVLTPIEIEHNIQIDGAVPYEIWQNMIDEALKD